MVVAKRSRLAERRKAVGLSQERLAERLRVDRSTVVRWELGDTTPHPSIRPHLATALRMSRDGLEALLAPPKGGRCVRVVHVGDRIELLAGEEKLLSLTPQAAAALVAGLAAALGRMAQSSTSSSGSTPSAASRRPT